MRVDDRSSRATVVVVVFLGDLTVPVLASPTAIMPIDASSAASSASRVGPATLVVIGSASVAKAEEEEMVGRGGGALVVIALGERGTQGLKWLRAGL